MKVVIEMNCLLAQTLIDLSPIDGQRQVAAVTLKTSCSKYYRAFKNDFEYHFTRCAEEGTLIWASPKISTINLRLR